ncbi:uncharacterized protein LOC143568711 [Bidens hawaiensis]|uniref:uncharacterized protein LOC143568711 n=1 Tax=Bidens hawaiensis TaxID=980011 RepID=UPI00404A1145
MFISGASFSTQHDADASKELDMMFYTEVLVKQPPAPKFSKLQQDIQTAIRKILTKRPDKIKALDSRLTHHFADELSVEVNVPKGMYPGTEFGTLNDHVEYEAMLQFLANGWRDASMLHWCQMYLYTLQNQDTRDTQVAFFNAQKITGEECNKNFAIVKEHLVQHALGVVYHFSYGT